MTTGSLLRTALLVLFGGVFLLFTGCSSSRPNQPKQSPSTETQGPSLFLLSHVSTEGLVLHDARNGSSRTLKSDVADAGPGVVSPSGQYVAFQYVGPDSSHLALFDRNRQTLIPLHAAAGEWTYSLAWHPTQDQLAFGVYQSTQEKTRGPGSIQVTTPNGTTRDVGCRAAREVLHWLPDGSLATRNDENLYVVETDDCSTISAHDARRMYHLTYAPEGEHLAFIHRELTYDRDAVEYVPDSSLVVSDAHLNSRNTLFGDERQVRHLHWSPDGSELAFDVRVKESNHRQIAVYDGSRTVYLTPPDQTTADQVYPNWSPSGNYLAFTKRRTDDKIAAVRVQGQTRHLGPVNESVWGWLDERSVVVPGPDTLRIQTLNGGTRYTHPRPSTLIDVWADPVS